AAMTSTIWTKSPPICARKPISHNTTSIAAISSSIHSPRFTSTSVARITTATCDVCYARIVLIMQNEWYKFVSKKSYLYGMATRHYRLEQTVHAIHHQQPVAIFPDNDRIARIRRLGARILFGVAGRRSPYLPRRNLKWRIIVLPIGQI